MVCPFSLKSPYIAPKTAAFRTLTDRARFANFHHERLESAIERYRKEILRVNGVLNEALKGKEYLVGNKCTYADLAFVTWGSFVPGLLGDEAKVEQMKKDYPDYDAWMQRLVNRPATKKVLDEKAKVNAQ